MDDGGSGDDDLGNAGRVDGELAFDALALHDAADGEHLTRARTAPRDDHAGEDLNAFLVAFENAAVDVHGIADLEGGDFRLQAGLFDLLEQLLAHGWFLSLGCGAGAGFCSGWGGIRGGAAGVLQQVRAALERAKPTVLASPAGDLVVVAVDEHLGDRQAPEHAGASVLRPFQKAIVAGEGIVLAAQFISQYAGKQADHGIDDRHCGHLATVEHEIAEGDLVGLQDQANALVKTFVPPAQQQQPLVAGELFDHRLVESSALRGEHDQSAGVGLALDFLDAGDDGFDLEDHAGSSAEGAVVDFLVFLRGPIADVVQSDVDQAALDGPLQQAFAQVTRKHLGE